MSMTEKLAYIKKLRHLTTEEISRRSGIPVGTLNKIFSGQTRHPAAQPMERLARVLRVPLRYLLDDALPTDRHVAAAWEEEALLLSEEELRLLTRLRELEPRCRRAAASMVELLAVPGLRLAGAPAVRRLPCLLAAARVEAGSPWGVLRPRAVLLPETDAAAREAEFAVLLADGSLEPLYPAGSVLLCRREEAAPRQGYALFLLNGAGYLRRLHRRHGTTRLAALNVSFRDIPVRPEDSLEYVGTVTGAARTWRWADEGPRTA